MWLAQGPLIYKSVSAFNFQNSEKKGKNVFSFFTWPCEFVSFRIEIFIFDINLINIHEQNLHMIYIHLFLNKA